MKVNSALLKLREVTVEPVLFLYMMIIFLESNALQELIFVKTCIQHYNPENITDCSSAKKENLTESVNAAAFWMKYNGACLFFFTLITSFYVGSWSDRLGRKFPMIVPPVGTILAASVNFVLSVFIKTHVSYLFVSSAISGITFGAVGVIAATFGFISDASHGQSRTKRIVILEAMIFIGGTLGIYIGGTFLKNVHYEYTLNGFAMVFMFEATVAAVIVIYIIFRVPNHVLDSNLLLPALSCMQLFNLQHVKDSITTVFRVRNAGKRQVVLLLLTALLFIYIGSVVQLTLAYYYVKQLGWSFNEYSHFHSMQFAAEGTALLIGLPVLFHFVKVSDHFVAILGMLSRIVGFIVFGLSKNDAMIYSCAALYMFSEYPVPALRSMLSKTVDSNEAGRIFAFTTILQNLCFLLGLFVLTTVFTESSFPGLSFEVVAGLQVLALLIFVYLYLTRKDIITVYETIENEDGSTEEICSVVAASDSVN